MLSRRPLAAAVLALVVAAALLGVSADAARIEGRSSSTLKLGRGIAEALAKIGESLKSDEEADDVLGALPGARNALTPNSPSTSSARSSSSSSSASSPSSSLAAASSPTSGAPGRQHARDESFLEVDAPVDDLPSKSLNDGFGSQSTLPDPSSLVPKNALLSSAPSPSDVGNGNAASSTSSLSDGQFDELVFGSNGGGSGDSSLPLSPLPGASDFLKKHPSVSFPKGGYIVSGQQQQEQSSPFLTSTAKYHDYLQTKGRILAARRQALGTLTQRKPYISRLKAYIEGSEAWVAAKREQLEKWLAMEKQRGLSPISTEQQRIDSAKDTLTKLLEQQRTDAESVNQWNTQLRKAEYQYKLEQQKARLEAAAEHEKSLKSQIEESTQARQDLEKELERINQKLSGETSGEGSAEVTEDTADEQTAATL